MEENCDIIITTVAILIKSLF